MAPSGPTPPSLDDARGASAGGAADGRGRRAGADLVHQRFSLRYVFEILFRRKRTIVVPLVLCTALAGVATRFVPLAYQSNTTILLGKDEVLNPLVKWQTAVSLSLMDHMTSFTKVIYSRTLLESCLRNLELLPKHADPLAVDDMLHRLAGAISTNVSGGDSFMISTKWDDPVLARDITAEVTRLFIDKSLEAGRKEASTAVGFLRAELRDYRGQLFTAESQLREYKERNPDKLPAQNGAYIGDLQSYRGKLAEIAVELKELDLLIQLYEQRLSGEQAMVVRSATFLNASPLQTRLEEKAIEVASKQAHMKVGHPDRVRAEAELAAMQELRTKERQSKEATSTEEVRSPIFQELLAKLQESRIERDTKRLQQDEYLQITAELQEKVAGIPRSEMVLNALEREVASLNEIYGTLRQKVEQARVSEQVELQSQENRFQILDPPQIPLKHSAPNLVMILVAGLLGGFVLGVGLVFVFEFLDPSVVREEELVFTFDEHVLATIPKLHTRGVA